MKTFLLFVLIQLSSWDTWAKNYCCDENNNNFYSNGTCIGGKAAKVMNCPGMFELTENEVGITFETDDAGGLIIDGDTPIPPDRYCYGTKKATMENVFVICIQEDPLLEQASTTLNVAFQFVSVVFILLTIFIYAIVPEMRDLQDKIIIQSISGLALGFICLGSTQFLNALEQTACQLMAYMIYFSFLYAFFWLNVLCFHIWNKVIQPKVLRNIVKWEIVYTCYATGGPLICLIIVMIANHAPISKLEWFHPGIGETKCWFGSLKQTFLYFYGPITILICANICYFVWTAIELWKQCNKSQKTRVLNYRLRLYSRLFFIMGITWVFEIISAAFENDKGIVKWIWFLSDALNALEGLTIFLILVVFRKKVIRSLANKTFCGITLPARWRYESDSECEVTEEEIAL